VKTKTTRELFGAWLTEIDIGVCSAHDMLLYAANSLIGVYGLFYRALQSCTSEPIWSINLTGRQDAEAKKNSPIAQLEPPKTPLFVQKSALRTFWGQGSFEIYIKDRDHTHSWNRGLPW
jgi:hypothetical protein